MSKVTRQRTEEVPCLMMRGVLLFGMLKIEVLCIALLNGEIVVKLPFYWSLCNVPCTFH